MWCMNDMICEGMHIVLSVLIYAYMLQYSSTIVILEITVV